MRTLHLACDHAGVELKEQLKEHLAKVFPDLEFVDHGTNDSNSCDYPVFAHALCRAVIAEKSFGILICGTGIGMSIAANRWQEIRAALCFTELHAQLTREHNNANVLCLGARMTGIALACAIAETFLKTDFAGGRHQRRIDALNPENS